MKGATLFSLAATLVSAGGCYFLVDTSGIVGAPELVEAGSDAGLVDAGPDAPVVEDSRLLAHWSFDEAPSDVVPDLTGHHHDGQLGTPALLKPGKDGGQALASTMTVQSLSGPDFPVRGTLSFWLRADFSGSQADGLNIFDGFDPSRSHLFVRVPNLYSDVTLQIACQTTGQRDYPLVMEVSNPASNTWIHLVLTWDSVAHVAAAYIDGNLLQQGDGGALASWAPSDQQFVFASHFPKGLIDEARVYSSMLTAGEVRSIP